MGLYTDIQTDVAEALDNDLSDTAADLVYVEVTAREYNPVSGKEYRITSNTTCRGVVSPIDNSMIDGEVFKVGDKRFMILDSEIDATPILGRIIQYAGDDYLINSIDLDEAGATWTIYGRTS